MLAFKPELPPGGTILCLGAHCDDVEIGCGGALLELQQRFRDVRIQWVVFSGEPQRQAETRAAALRLLGPECALELYDFRGSYFPFEGEGIKDTFELLKSRIRPDLIFTHHLHDRHQDHRVIAEYTWNTFRDHAILEFEIPKFEGDLGHPNVFIPLSRATLERKVGTLMDCFPSQRARQWFDADLFYGHMRLRGVECNSPSRYAEAFHARKLLV
jgi:LmbE family N-acetylglucosaminyl deacetylase